MNPIVRALVAIVKETADRHPTYSYSGLSRSLNRRKIKTATGREWTPQGIRMFMTKQGISHKSDEFTPENVIKENRLESIRLL